MLVKQLFVLSDVHTAHSFGSISRYRSHLRAEQSPGTISRRLRALPQGAHKGYKVGLLKISLQTNNVDLLTSFDSIWRPLANPVEDWPLAVCDGRTVKKSSLIEADVVRRDYVSSNMFLKYDEAHKWHYLDKQQMDEVLIFKQFDTRTDVDAHCEMVSKLLSCP